MEAKIFRWCFAFLGTISATNPTGALTLKFVGYAKLLDDTQTPYVKHNNEHIINIKKK